MTYMFIVTNSHNRVLISTCPFHYQSKTTNTCHVYVNIFTKKQLSKYSKYGIANKASKVFVSSLFSKRLSPGQTRAITACNEYTPFHALSQEIRITLFISSLYMYKCCLCLVVYIIFVHV